MLEVSIPVTGKLLMPLEAWRKGYEAGQARVPSACPYAPQSREAWAWSSGRIEGLAAKRV